MIDNVSAQPLTTTPSFMGGAAQRPVFNSFASLHSSRMDAAILLFHLIVKITTVEGVMCREHPHLSPIQGGNVSMQNLSSMTVLIDCYRFEDTSVSVRLPSAAYNTPSLSRRSFLARSWRSTLSLRCRMPFDAGATRSHGTRRAIIPAISPLNTIAILFISITIIGTLV